VTFRSLNRRRSNSSSGSDDQANFRRGMGPNHRIRRTMVSRVAVADNRGGRPAGGVGCHGLRLGSIAKIGRADPVRQAGERAIRSLLVNMLGALHCALHKAPRQRHPHAAKRARGTLLRVLA
jgi:hypothetical protein